MEAHTKSPRTLGAVMTRDPITLKLDDTLRLADDLMNLAHLRHFPVLDGERVAGIVDQTDLLHASMASLLRRPHDRPRQALGAVTIKEIMKPAATVSADTGIREAARLMADLQMECLLVTEKGKLVGMVTRTDLLRELSRE